MAMEAASDMNPQSAGFRLKETRTRDWIKAAAGANLWWFDGDAKKVAIGTAMLEETIYDHRNG